MGPCAKYNKALTKTGAIFLWKSIFDGSKPTLKKRWVGYSSVIYSLIYTDEPNIGAHYKTSLSYSLATKVFFDIFIKKQSFQIEVFQTGVTLTLGLSLICISLCLEQFRNYAPKARHQTWASGQQHISLATSPVDSPFISIQMLVEFYSAIFFFMK